MRWHALLMQNILICISCSAFVTNATAALTGYQCQYLDQGQPNQTVVFAMVHCSMRDTDTFVTRAQANHGPCNMQNEEKVLDAVHANSLASTRWVTYETGLSHSAVWCEVLEEQLGPFHIKFVFCQWCLCKIEDAVMCIVG
jgi:hypothetical protein